MRFDPVESKSIKMKHRVYMIDRILVGKSNMAGKGNNLGACDIRVYGQDGRTTRLECHANPKTHTI